MTAGQAIAAYYDGYLTQGQMIVLGRHGYAWVEHGGTFVDLFVITPAMAYITSQYRLAYTAWWGWLLLGLTAIVVLWSMQMYSQIAVSAPEAHTHHGETTIAGWIHGVYAIWGIWVFALFLVTPTTPHTSIHDLLLVAVALTILFPLGVIKFNSTWSWTISNSWQVGIEIAGVWLITTVRIAFNL